jgi:hypothetical protein
MAVAWPVSLQDKLNEDSFSFQIGETVLRSDMDVGPVKVRRRMTKSTDLVTCSINVTSGEYSVFKTFYDVTLNGGVTLFTFNHPITGAPQDFRFVGAPSVRSIGGGNYVVSMVWEILAQ